MSYSLVLAGMLRDSTCEPPQKILDHLRVILQKIRSSLSKLAVVVVCNRDETYRLLSSYRDINNEYQLHLLLAPDSYQTTQRIDAVAVHSYNNDRLKKMASLRNLYLSYIHDHAELKTFDFLGVLDMDLMGTFDVHCRLSHSLKRLALSSYDGITCNGKLAHWKNRACYLYGDTFAFVDRFGRHASFWEKANPLFFLWRYPKLQDEKSAELYPVKSAFGGMAVYKMRSAMRNQYGFSTTIPLSEHIYFHQGMAIAHDSSLVFRITRNAT